MEIKVLGMGCPKCERVETLAKQVVDNLGVQATFTKVDTLDEIMSYDVLGTPALVIDDEVKASGRIPRPEEIADWIRAAAGE